MFNSFFSGIFQKELYQAELKPDTLPNRVAQLKLYSDPPNKKHTATFLKIKKPRY
jgi:hypothetical protein